MLKQYIVGVDYQTPGGAPNTWRALVMADSEERALRLGEARCRRERRVAKIDGGDVSEIRVIGSRAGRVHAAP